MSGWAVGAGAPDRATSDGQWPGETPIRPSLTASSAGTVVGPADDHSGLLEMASEASPGTNREASRRSSHHHPSLQFALFADAGQGCERLRSNTPNQMPAEASRSFRFSAFQNVEQTTLSN